MTIHDHAARRRGPFDHTTTLLFAVAMVVASLGAVLLALPAPTASADPTGTVVFIKNNNVWIMPAADPAAARPLTTDGTADDSYAIPAADDFGVVYAVTAGGFGDIVRMDHAGNRLGAPFRPAQALAAIDAIRPSPDGQILTYTSVQYTVNPDGSGGNLIIPVFFVNFAYADGRDSSAIEHRLDGGYAVWYGEDRVVFDPVTASEGIDEYDRYVLGQAAAQNWFATCSNDDPFPPACNVVGVMDVTRGLERMAAVRYNNEFTDEPAGIVAYALNGAPPARPTRTCTFEANTAAASILNVAWSPDGDSLLWDYTATTGQPAPAGAGIYLAEGFETGTCSAAFARRTLVVADATQPYWSAAAFGTSAPGTSGEYIPLQPERLLDTRAEAGPLGYAGGKPGVGSVVEVDVTGVGSSSVPDSAQAVVMNITGVDPSAAGFVTVWPCGQPRPTASNLNLVAGQVAPNLTITKVGANGRVCLFTQAGTHLIADIAGYFPAGSSYQSLQPERLLDTRAEAGPLGYAGGKPGVGSVVEVDVTGVGSSSVPDSAQAVVMNITGVDPSAAGFVTVWPCGQPRPTASNLNLVAGQVAPNLTITKVGANGRVCLFTQAGTHLIADIAGYFPAGSSYQSLQPERLLDTRAEAGPLGYAGGKPGVGSVVEVDVTGVGSSSVPDSAQAVVMNITGVDPSAAGFVTVWPCGQPRPTASNLNLVAGQVAPNLTITKVGANGRVCLFTQAGTHLIADIAGYFPAGT